MSSENCQDFEVKYINDACKSVCVCGDLCVCVSVEEAKRLWPGMVTKIYQHYNHYLSSGHKI